MTTEPMTREERRAAMPECAEFIDLMRAEFGELNSIHAEENGHIVHWEKPRENDASHV